MKDKSLLVETMYHGRIKNLKKEGCGTGFIDAKREGRTGGVEVVLLPLKTIHFRRQMVMMHV